MVIVLGGFALQNDMGSIIFLGRVSEQFQLLVIIGFGGKIVFVIWVDFVANMNLVCVNQYQLDLTCFTI